MPLDFENSSMKNSFSMSSLQPSSRVCLEQSSQATHTPSPLLPNRAYNSLTHKLRKRTPEQEAWRNSWGLDDHKNEFWASFESNYQYLMNNNLIDSCKEAKNDLYPSSSQDWTYSHFKQQFLELNSWLNSIQKTIYTNEDNMTVSIRLNQIDEMKRRNYQRKNFVNQSTRLVTRFPEHKDEILDYVSQLNTKWDLLAQTVTPKNTMSVDCFSRRKDLLCELRCLGKWIHAVENKLEPVNFRKKWTLNQLKQKAREHEAIQKDVDSHRKPIVSIVKLCENFSQNTNNTCDSRTGNGLESEAKRNSTLKRAKRLEERWQHLYLKCLEWQCFIENRISVLQTESSNDAGTDDDDEKSSFKHRRLNNSTAQKCLFPANVKKDDSVDIIMDVEGSTIRSINDPMRILRGDIDYDGVKKLDSGCLSSTPTNSPCDVQLNDNFNSLKLYKASDDPIPIEFTPFNRTVNSASNIAVRYYRHEDTDLEQETTKKTTAAMDEVVVVGNGKISDDSSSGEDEDDEWTYRNAANDSMETGASSSANDETLNETRRDDTAVTATTAQVDCGDGCNNLSKRVPARSIRKLVDGAEELVNAVKKSQTKRKSDSGIVLSRMKGRQNEQVVDWLRKCRSNDDCSEVNSTGDSYEYDGGSEDTNEDNDQFERRSSCDQTMTLVGSSRDNGIDVSPTISSDEPKVVLRCKNGSSKKSRPFSTPALSYSSSRGLTPMQWSSETALSTPTSRLTPLKDARGGTLSSSTMDECVKQTLNGSGCSINSLRRRKLKCRRRSTTGRKGYSGSADSFSSLNGHETTVGSRRTYLSPARLSRNVNKSETLSEPITGSRFSTSTERAIASDPANCMYNATTTTTTTTSGTETEEESNNSRKCLARRKSSQLPVFRFGPQHGVVTCRDNAAAVSVTSNEEQLSSFSEHAWDDYYQEKYVSEAYSEEAVDQDKVKRVTEFGEDYRNYIDSHSDCASSFTGRSCTIYGQSTLIAEDESSPLDSDSDLEEDVRSFLQQSHTQLCNIEQLFAKQIAKPSPCSPLTDSDFAEIRNTCRQNIRCLKMMLEGIERDVPSHKPQQKSDLKSMLEKWECLDDQCSIKRNISELSKELLDVSSRIPSKEFQFEDQGDLERNILLLERELDDLMDKKKLIGDYNFKTHCLQKDSKYSTPSLNDDIKDLYCIWDRVHQKVEDQLNVLQKASMSWRQFDEHMEELKTVLRQNHDNLNELDRALRRDECVVEDVVSSVRNIDKHWPDKQYNNLMKLNNNSTTWSADQVENNVFTFVTNALNVEGSLSDSGISDSGSEHDTCERRLTLLKKLAQHLKSILAPGSDALLTIMRKVDETEQEFKELQKTCRTIFNNNYLDKENRLETQVEKENIEEENIIAVNTNPGDPEPDPGKGKSFFWRVLRASVPFHVAFVVLLCVACFLEPNCCDTINNLHLSFTPQLRYRSGPPPT